MPKGRTDILFLHHAERGGEDALEEITEYLKCFRSKKNKNRPLLTSIKKRTENSNEVYFYCMYAGELFSIIGTRNY